MLDSCRRAWPCPILERRCFRLASAQIRFVAALVGGVNALPL
jgi:hypothetical protein